MSIASAIRKREAYKRTHSLYWYEPYPFQKAFHHARRGQTYLPGDYAEREGLMATDRAAVISNQTGKTHSAGMEVAMHMTGEYPKWWRGHRYNHKVNVLVAGKTNDTTRDVVQKELLGNPKIPGELGTGAIPRHLLHGQPVRKAGVPLAFQSFTVKHVTGGISTCQFMAFEQGAPAFMGRNDYKVAWLDEEPPNDVMSQVYRCFFAQRNYTIMLTFTPEEGMTQIVDGFLNNLQKDQALIRATWDDAPHMTTEAKASFLAKLPPHERDMRSKGIPLMGSGVVFPIKEDQIVIEPIPIPAHWRRLCGVDFGIDHPFAAVWIAHDTETDTIHIYGDYRIKGATPAVHASAIRNKGDWIPVAWPHDGLIRDKGSGVPLADIYRNQEHVNMLKERFTNPPGPGQKEGQGGNGVEVGIIEMWQRMETGRLKVHSTCQSWLEEFRGYHRKDGKIVNLKDDCIAASRYAIQSIRFAYTQPVRHAKVVQLRGASNW